MQSLQQTVFHNLSKSSVYKSQIKKIVDKQGGYPKYLHNKGKLSQQQIISYLKDKYQQLNIKIINQVFRSMQWNDGYVTKQQFTDKYLKKQKKIFHQIKTINNYGQWRKTLEDIYQDSLQYKPNLYVFLQIANIQLYHSGEPVQWMDLFIEYENHQSKVTYTIEQHSHEADQPSFQVWLPSQQTYFFTKIRFHAVKQTNLLYGRSYVNEAITENLPKTKNMTVDITLDNKIVGHCNIIMRFQNSMETVKKQIHKSKDLELRYHQMLESKVKEYEYMQFLWGIRHKSPQKISPLDVTWMLFVRTLLIILLGAFALLIHIYGRCQPLSFVVFLLLLKNRSYVMLRSDKFLITWLALTSLVLDIVWVVFSSKYLSSINFYQFSSSQIVTYGLIATKIIILLYLLLFEKSFDND